MTKDRWSLTVLPTLSSSRYPDQACLRRRSWSVISRTDHRTTLHKARHKSRIAKVIHASQTLTRRPRHPELPLEWSLLPMGHLLLRQSVVYLLSLAKDKKSWWKKHENAPKHGIISPETLLPEKVSARLFWAKMTIYWNSSSPIAKIMSTILMSRKSLLSSSKRPN